MPNALQAMVQLGIQNVGGHPNIIVGEHLSEERNANHAHQVEGNVELHEAHRLLETPLCAFERRHGHHARRRRITPGRRCARSE